MGLYYTCHNVHICGKCHGVENICFSRHLTADLTYRFLATHVDEILDTFHHFRFLICLTVLNIIRSEGIEKQSQEQVQHLKTHMV